MTYLKMMLSGLAAAFFGLIGPGLFNFFRGISQQKATGLGAVAGGFAEALFNPLFWILVVAFFLGFRAASRVKSVVLQTLLFWIPTVTASVMALVTSALLVYILWMLKAKAGS